MRQLSEVSFVDAVKHPRKGMGLERFFKAIGANGKPELLIYEHDGLIYIEHPDSPATITPVTNVRFMLLDSSESTPSPKASTHNEKATQASPTKSVTRAERS